MKLIVGLGNPGKEYENTRHNIGYMIIDNFVNSDNWKKESLAYILKQTINNENVLFIKPTTYMNLSGQAVQYYLNYYKIDTKDLLVIQDDMDLDIGKVRLKFKSSAGGHNGIKDIIKNIKTDEFLRLKIGISKPTNDTIEFVLGKFPKLDLEILNNNMNMYNQIITDFINDTKIETLMNRYN